MFRMDVVPFVHHADPDPQPRLGAMLEDGHTLVDLQAGHFSMRGGPSPWLRDKTTFESGREAARRVAEDVVTWVRSQRPPGVTARMQDVKVVE